MNHTKDDLSDSIGVSLFRLRELHEGVIHGMVNKMNKNKTKSENIEMFSNFISNSSYTSVEKGFVFQQLLGMAFDFSTDDITILDSIRDRVLGRS